MSNSLHEAVSSQSAVARSQLPPPPAPPTAAWSSAEPSTEATQPLNDKNPPKLTPSMSSSQIPVLSKVCE